MIWRSAATARCVLPRPGLADEQQAGALLVGEIAGELLHRQQHGGQFAARRRDSRCPALRNCRTTRCGRARGICERSSRRAARPCARQSHGSAPEILACSTMMNPVPPHLAQTVSLAMPSIIGQTARRAPGFRAAKIRQSTGVPARPPRQESPRDRTRVPTSHLPFCGAAWESFSISRSNATPSNGTTITLLP